MGNTICPVCNTSIELQTRFCPTCGFERHILPNGVSGEVQADENERIAKAKEFYEAAKSAIDKAKTATDKEMQSKLDEANKALEDEKKAHEETKSNLAKEQTAHNRTQDALKDEEAAHKETKSNLDKEQTAHNRTQDALKKEQTALKNEKAAHEETKSNLAKEKDAHMQTKKKLDDAKKNPPTSPRPVPTPIPIPNKKVIGKALFTQGGRSEAVDLYEGGCIVTAPAWTNVKGELFEIQPNGDDYILTDLKGYMYNRLGNSISSNGVFTFNDDYFTIGNLLIKLSLPENN